VPEFEVLHESGSAKAPVQWMGYIDLTRTDQFNTRFSDQAVRDMVNQHTVPTVTFSHSGQAAHTTAHPSHTADIKAAWDMAKRTMAEQSEQMIVNPDDMLDALKEHATTEQRAAVEHGIITGAIEVNQWIPKGTAVKIKHPGTYCRCGNCRKQGCGSATESVWDAHLRQERERREALKNSRTGTPDVIKIAIEIQEDVPAEAANQAAVTKAPESPQPRSSRLLTELKRQLADIQSRIGPWDGSARYFGLLNDIYDLETAIAALEPKPVVAEATKPTLHEVAAKAFSSRLRQVLDALKHHIREFTRVSEVTAIIYGIPALNAGWMKRIHEVLEQFEATGKRTFDLRKLLKGTNFGVMEPMSRYYDDIPVMIALEACLHEFRPFLKDWDNTIIGLADAGVNIEDVLPKLPEVGILKPAPKPDKITLKIQEIEKALSDLPEARIRLSQAVDSLHAEISAWYVESETTRGQDKAFATFADFFQGFKKAYANAKGYSVGGGFTYNHYTQWAGMMVAWVSQLSLSDNDVITELSKDIGSLVQEIKSERDLKHVLDSLKEQQAASYPANPQHYDNNDE